MPNSIRRLFGTALYPLRIQVGRFALINLPAFVDLPAFEDQMLRSTIAFKAASYVAADKIPGDYLEFGVYSGKSFAAAYKAINRAFELQLTPSIWNTAEDRIAQRGMWERMRFFAFDSFRGLPPLTGVDASSRDFVEGKYACSKDDFVKNISDAGVPLSRVRVVDGWFQDTLNSETCGKLELRKASIVHIDCDLYESAKVVLEFVTNLVVDGTVIILDDWFSYRGNPNMGEQRAFREWLTRYPHLIATPYQTEGPWRNSFIVNKP